MGEKECIPNQTALVKMIEESSSIEVPEIKGLVAQYKRLTMHDKNTVTCQTIVPAILQALSGSFYNSYAMNAVIALLDGVADGCVNPLQASGHDYAAFNDLYLPVYRFLLSDAWTGSDSHHLDTKRNVILPVWERRTSPAMQ